MQFTTLTGLWTPKRAQRTQLWSPEGSRCCKRRPTTVPHCRQSCGHQAYYGAHSALLGADGGDTVPILLLFADCAVALPISRQCAACQYHPGLHAVPCHIEAPSLISYLGGPATSACKGTRLPMRCLTQPPALSYPVFSRIRSYRDVVPLAPPNGGTNRQWFLKAGSLVCQTHSPQATLFCL